MKIKAWKFLAGLFTLVSYVLVFGSGLYIGHYGEDAGLWPAGALVGASVVWTVSSLLKIAIAAYERY